MGSEAALNNNQFRLKDYIAEASDRIEVTFPREAVNVGARYQLELLRQPESVFLPCQDITLSESAVKLTYARGENTENLTRAGNKTEIEKLLLLINVSGYFDQRRRRYFTTFAPENIYFSDAYDISFVYRNIDETLPPFGQTKLTEFEEYKALILSALQNKYDFYSLMEIGIDVLNKDAYFSDIISAQTVEEVRGILRARYNDLYRDTVKNKIAFRKRNVTIAAFASIGVFIYCLPRFSRISPTAASWKQTLTGCAWTSTRAFTPVRRRRSSSTPTNSATTKWIPR